MSHTKSPEPWSVGERDPVVLDATGQVVAAYAAATESEMDYLWDEDAKRIVACVNACRGVPNEILERISVERILRLLGVIASIPMQMGRIREMADGVLRECGYER